MKNRCNNPKDIYYKNYGGRGITYCDEWEWFENFLRDMGQCPEGMTLERIDNNGNYCRENCRWATRVEQMNNTRSNHWIDYNGDVKTLTQWSKITGISLGTLNKRLKNGWSIEDTLFKAVKK
jgi:hypothetical protein